MKPAAPLFQFVFVLARKRLRQGVSLLVQRF